MIRDLWTTAQPERSRESYGTLRNMNFATKARNRTYAETEQYTDFGLNGSAVRCMCAVGVSSGSLAAGAYCGTHLVVGV